MKNLLAALMFVTTSAFASYSGEIAPSVTARLTDKPCTNKLLMQLIKPEYHSRARAGTVTFHPEKVTVNICWMELDGNLYGVDETGSSGQFDSRRLKKDLEI